MTKPASLPLFPARPDRRRVLSLMGGAAVGIGVATASRPAVASGLEKSLAPKPEPWPKWERHDPGSTATLDHGAWDGFLKRHVRVAGRGDGEPNRIAYGAVPAADRAELDAYLERLQAVPVSTLSRAEQLPFWINLYNALTVRTVLQHYPVAGIRDIDISPGLFADGPWGRKLVTVEGEGLSLDAIEHRILRPVWRDPRIHYAVNCASVGCPDLQPEAFTAATMERLLDAGARTYVNDPRGVAFGPKGPIVSKIYLWFQVDFGDSEAGVLAHLRHHAGPALLARLEGVTAIADFAYDWSLNDLPAGQ